MFQVRFHGRGGQGVVTAAEVLSVAAFLDGLEAQAFPSFGAERTGSPVAAFCRVSDAPIRDRQPVTTPDAIVVQDATLLKCDSTLLAGLSPAGYVLLNAPAVACPNAFSRLPSGHFVALPASEFARRHVGRPLPNAPLLGALAALTGIVTLDALREALRWRFPGPAGVRNADAAGEAFHAARRGESLTAAVS